MKKHQREYGQSLVFIALAFPLLIAMAALIIDGGNLYLNRRNAQTAVDAAALAGAREMCVEKGSLSDVQAIVNQYAVSENGATAVESVTIDENGFVVVRARLETSSFFSRILGYETNTVRAEASAGCFTPRTTENLLPIAWTCQPPVGGSIGSCDVEAIPWNVFEILLSTFNFGPGVLESMLLTEGDGADRDTYMDAIGGKMAYLVMDSDSFNSAIDCIELNPLSGQINCDFDDDGILEVEGGANRGWLLLDGGTGANDLVNVMLYGYPDPITLPHWFPGKSGVSNNVFINAHQVLGKISLVPVYNAICPDTNDYDIPTVCSTEYQAGDLISGSSGLKTYYRVAGFAPFVVTCVSKGNSEKCPAKKFAGIDGNVSTIEGYFVSGYTAGTGVDPGGFDLGVYIISLTK